MVAVLVTGAVQHVADVAGALRSQGAEVTEVVDLQAVPAVCARAGGDAFDSYVQLPAAFDMRGDTAIDRVHHFYGRGVLARFPALAGALGSLKSPARVTFVLGQLPADAARADDREARRALVRVLTDAARADFADGELIVRVRDVGATPEEIALTALGRDEVVPEPVEELDRASYAEWRVELLGSASMQT
jgi:hypothetical protein